MVQRATAAGVELNAAAYNVMLKELRLEGDSDGYARLKVGSHFRLRCPALRCALLRCSALDTRRTLSESGPRVPRTA